MPKESRPKSLYVNQPLGPEDQAGLIDKGWQTIDVRVLPNKSDNDKATTLKAWLEGVRQGSIILDKDIIKLIELEARTYGLVGQKTIEKPRSTDDAQDTVDELLDMFSSKRAVRTRTPRPRTHNPQGGHPYTHNRHRTDYPQPPKLTGIFNKKIARAHFEELIDS